METLYKKSSLHSRHQSYNINICHSSRPTTLEKDPIPAAGGMWLSTLSVSKIQTEIRKLHKNFHLSSETDLLKSITSLIKSFKPPSSIPPEQSPSSELITNPSKTESSKYHKSASIASSNEEGTETFDDKIRTLSVKEIHLEEILRRLKRKEKTLDLIKADLIKEKIDLVDTKKYFNGIKNILVERLKVVEDKVKNVSEMFVRSAEWIEKGKKRVAGLASLEDEIKIFHESCQVLERNRKDLDELTMRAGGILCQETVVGIDCLGRGNGVEGDLVGDLDKVESTLENIDFYLNQLNSYESKHKYHQRRKSTSSDVNSSLSLSSVLQKTPNNSIKPVPSHTKTQSLQESSLSILKKERELEEKHKNLLQEKEKLKKDSEILFNIHKDFEQKKTELEKVKKEIKKDRKAISTIIETHEKIKETSQNKAKNDEDSHENKNIFKESLKNLVKKKSLHYKNQDWVVRVFDHDNIDGN